MHQFTPWMQALVLGTICRALPGPTWKRGREAVCPCPSRVVQCPWLNLGSGRRQGGRDAKGRAMRPDPGAVMLPSLCLRHGRCLVDKARTRPVWP